MIFYLSPLVAVFATLLFGSLIFLLLDLNPFESFKIFFISPISNSYGLSELLVKATPLAIIALGLSYCFKNNIYNIGAEGQLTMGAIFGGGLGILFYNSDSFLLLPAMILFGGIGGALWALIPAILKTKFNTNEILTSLMLTYIAILILDYLVVGPWKDPASYGLPKSRPLGSDTICYNTIPSLLSSPVVSGGAESYSYQWYKDGNVIAGATDSTYQPLALISSSSYSVEVSDLCGTLMSNSINITVLSDLAIDLLLDPPTICYGEIPLVLSSPTVSGGEGSYTYQWYMDGFPISEATNDFYQSNALFADAQFSVEATDICGLIESNSITISVSLTVIGNNSAQNQIRFGQIMKYGEEKGNVGNILGDVNFDEFAKILGGHGESVREAKDIQPALQRAREAVKSGIPAIVNIWVDKEEFAPGTKNQTMYK